MEHTEFVYEQDTTWETWEEVYEEMSDTGGMDPEPGGWAVYTARALKEDGYIDTSGASTITVLVWEGGAAIKNNAYTEWFDTDGEGAEAIISGYYNPEPESD